MEHDLVRKPLHIFRDHARKNHDGRACARPSRFQRCYPQLKTEIKSITWCDAGSGLSTQTGLVLATLTLGEPNVSIWEQDSAAAKRSKLKRVLQCVGARVLIILGIDPVAI